MFDYIWQRIRKKHTQVECKQIKGCLRRQDDTSTRFVTIIFSSDGSAMLQALRSELKCVNKVNHSKTEPQIKKMRANIFLSFQINNSCETHFNTSMNSRAAKMNEINRLGGSNCNWNKSWNLKCFCICKPARNLNITLYVAVSLGCFGTHLHVSGGKCNRKSWHTNGMTSIRCQRIENRLAMYWLTMIIQTNSHFDTGDDVNGINSKRTFASNIQICVNKIEGDRQRVFFCSHFPCFLAHFRSASLGQQTTKQLLIILMCVNWVT